MTKYGFTSINGDFIFARNAKSALVDDCLLEDIIWLRKYAAPTGILIDPKFDKCRLHIHKTIPQFGIRIVHKKVGSLTNILYLYR